MIPSRFLPLSAVVLSFSLSAIACGGSGESDEENTNDKLVSGSDTQSCEAPDAPTDLNSFKKLSSCELGKLFDAESAKVATAESKLPEGPYDGIPLCRKDMLDIHYEEVPESVRNIFGFRLIWDALKLSNTIDNGLAGAVWHGKWFTPPAAGSENGDVLGYQEIGDVNNFIDITSGRVAEDARRSAEAKFYIEKEPERRWLTLNYSGAQTGLRVIKNFSVEVIRHVYDTARLVDKERGIYLGMAWMIEEPGKFPGTYKSPGTEGKIVPSCYFALKKRPMPTK